MIFQIQELPEELKALVNLKCLNLNWTWGLFKIPQQLLSNFSRLRVLRMFSICFRPSKEEQLGLKYLEVLEITLGSFRAHQTFFSSRKLPSCTQALWLEGEERFDTCHSTDLVDLAALERLDTLHVFYCP